MKIIGYSERGAMNALFYGIALSKNNAAMEAFLELAHVRDTYDDYALYIECSLSDFGTPDLVIVAQKGERNDVFFVEAKVSGGCSGKYFSLNSQITVHKEFCGYNGEKPNDNKYDASNVFFQLRLKELFTSTNNKFKIKNKDAHDNRIRCKKRRWDNANEGSMRSIGSNNIVSNFAKIVRDKCDNPYFIAIIPQCEGYEKPEVKSFFDLDIHIVTWESILNNEILCGYLKDTVLFNQDDIASQILNTPINDLMGRRLQQKPASGYYIQGGKKYFVK